MANDRPDIGYIGLGFMGGPMAQRLLRAGHPVRVWGRTAARLEPFTAAGAVVTASPAAMAADCDVVFLCVSDTAAVRDVVFGAEGIASGGAAGRILIDMSSIEPEATREMAATLRADTGMGWIDAPVSGGPPAAEGGTLTVMAGGEPADFDAVRALVLENLAARFTLMGPNGAGQATKLINQAIVASTLALLAETTRLAQNAGIDARRLPEALAGGRADSMLMQTMQPRMAAGDFEVTSFIDTMIKDLNTVQDLARATGTALPITGTATELHRLLAAHGHGQDDVTAIMKLYGDAKL